VASQEFLQWLGVMAMGVEIREESRDGVRDFACGATEAYGAGDGGELAYAAAYAEIVGVDHLAVLLDFFAFEADVGDPVLAAGVGAAGDVEFDFFLIAGETLVELFGEPAGVGLGFGESEFAEFGAGARYGAANERVSKNGQASGIEGFDDGGSVEPRNVNEQKIFLPSRPMSAIQCWPQELGQPVMWSLISS